MSGAAEELLARLVAAPAGTAGSASDEALATLRARGHRIVREDERLRLLCAADHFDPAAFAPAGTLGAPLEVWETIGSTNDRAREAAREGAPAGALWLAEAQTAGRGRQGRAWCAAPHTGLLISVLLDVRRIPAITLLPLAIGLGARESIARQSGVAVRTKWPNDLVVGDRKLAGTLVEVVGEGHAIVGLGLNVRRGATAGFDLPVAVALADVGPELGREPLLAALLAGIERRIDDWRAGRHARLVADYLAHESTLDRQVRVQAGNALVEGRVRGLTPAGGLQVETRAGALQTLVAGEIHFV